MWMPKKALSFVSAIVGICMPVLAQPCKLPLTNGSFEEEDPLFPGLPEGWEFLPWDGPQWRHVDDGALVRTGDFSIELPTVPGHAFVGCTTDLPDGQGGFYNPDYTYGGGPLIVSGWYAIPEEEPLVNAKASLKLEFRRENWSIYQSFERLEIEGHTNGEWFYQEIVITKEELDADGGPWPPPPIGVSILPIRFGPNTNDQSGTIFWDDLRVVQLPLCGADMTGTMDPGSPEYGVPDGNVDADDFFFYMDLFQSGDPMADLTGSQNPMDELYGVCDGTIDANDFFFYLTLFDGGCDEQAPRQLGGDLRLLVRP
eukprot:TRINITY_DN975_c0_g1_i4.p1 TRINITY_DN975_c0_g1~~TRINITY_DN975_c0_g1_i4.p1  ORF type:complete len:313 (-),score=32.48 TRINITY_DN975_c0_g1_i4:233-1171(-)